MANLLNNPDFETDALHWSANGSATISRDTSAPLSGVGSLKIVTSASVANGGAFNGRYNISVGPSYTYSFKVKGTSGVVVTGEVDWFDANGVFMDGTVANLTLDGTTQTFSTNFTFPANSVQATVLVRKAAIGTTTYWIDDVSLDQTSVPSVTIVSPAMGSTAASPSLSSVDDCVPSAFGSAATISVPSISGNSGSTTTITAPPMTASADCPIQFVLLPSQSDQAKYEADPYGWVFYLAGDGGFLARRRQEGTFFELHAATVDSLCDRIAEYEATLAARNIPISHEWGQLWGTTSSERRKLLSIG